MREAAAKAVRGPEIDQPWLRAPETRAVMAALEAGGKPARFVGGCVRDALLGRAVADIDIATPEKPARVLALLADAGIKAIPTGIEHGTITAVTGGRPFEITTLRRDVRPRGRHAEVAFIDDWVVDARRRDFTMNALFCDGSGRIHDPMGGLDDLRAGRLRFIGDPERRIAEDGLRILRFFRFHASHGRGPMDPAGLAACARRAEDIDNLSVERVAGELRRLLAAPAPGASLRAMAECGILAQCLPEAVDFDALEGLCKVENETGRGDPWRRLMALTRCDPTAADAMARRLRLSNEVRKRLIAMAGSGPDIAPGKGIKAARRAIYRCRREAFIDRAMLGWAEHPTDSGWPALIAEAEHWRRPKLPVGGDDALALGLSPGRAIGEVLRQLETWWIDHDFPGERAVRAQLKKIIEAHVSAGGA